MNRCVIDLVVVVFLIGMLLALDRFHGNHYFSRANFERVRGYYYTAKFDMQAAVDAFQRELHNLRNPLNQH